MCVLCDLKKIADMALPPPQAMVFDIGLQFIAAANVSDEKLKLLLPKLGEAVGLGIQIEDRSPTESVIKIALPDNQSTVRLALPESEPEKKGTESMASPAPFPNTPPPVKLHLEQLLKAVDNQKKKEEDKKDLKFSDVAVERKGDKIILPDGMDLDEGMVWMYRRKMEEETEIKVHHEFDAYPVEGAYALLCVLQDKFGFVDIRGTPGFFGDKPPTFIGVEVAPGKTVQVPWGRLVISGISGWLSADYVVKPDKSVKFQLQGVVLRKSEDAVNRLAMDVRQYLKDKSLFRGKAIEVSFPDPDDDNEFSVDPGYLPKVLETDSVDPAELIFPDDVQEMVDDNLFGPIEFTEACRMFQIPLKRGILLEGTFGVGKTLTAAVTRKKCVDNGWTYIYVRKAKDTVRAISLARQYQPALVFSEDIDTEMNGDERTEEINDILNTLDGVTSKGTEVMVVFTTNKVNDITKALLRPGRLDAVIPVRAPDAVAAQKLMRLYGRNLIPADEDLTEAGLELAHQLPAFIREAVERSKLGAIRRLKNKGDSLVIVAKDLITAARGMQAQIELLKEPDEETFDSNKESAANILGKQINSGLTALASAMATAKNGHVKETKEVRAT